MIVILKKNKYYKNNYYIKLDFSKYEIKDIITIMEREQFTLISVLLILAEFYLCTEANSYKQLQVYLEKSNVQLTRSKSASVGDMSRIACAGKCLELGDECCKATYIESTKECRIGLNGCCNIPEEYVPGTYLLQAKPPLLIGEHLFRDVKNTHRLFCHTKKIIVSKGHC